MSLLNKTTRQLLSLKELTEQLAIKDYDTLFETVTRLVNECSIKPVLTTKTNGMSPPLYNKYRILREKHDYSGEQSEIKRGFPPAFRTDYYLANPEEYLESRETISALISYWRTQQTELQAEMSINERSYRIFKDEKRLGLKDTRQVLKNLQIRLESFNVYCTPEPFFYFKAGSGSILIIENKDTWYTFCRLMKKGQSVFIGTEVGAVVYGEGNKILRQFSDELTNHRDPMFRNLKTPLLYCGDIDHTGFSIYSQLKNQLEGIRDIGLWLPGYRRMMALYDQRSFRDMKPGQRKSGVDKVLQEFTEEERDWINGLFQSGAYIPQEILNYQELTDHDL